MTAFLCMSEAELDLWRKAAASFRSGNGSGTDTPCTDCPMWFHLEEKAAGRCDRVPQPRGGVPGSPGRKAQWREASRRSRAHATWDNGAAGSSSQSNRLSQDTRVSATTRGAGVVAFRGSSSNA